jgi:hypothetical protein
MSAVHVVRQVLSPSPSPSRCAARVLAAILVAAGAVLLSLAAHAATASFSPNEPAPGPNDIFSLIGTGGTDYTNGVSKGNSAYIASNQSIVGQTFTTGNNPFGYLVNSVTLRQVTHKTYCEVYDIDYTIRITSTSGSSLAVLDSETCFVPNGTPGNIPTIYPLYDYQPGSGIYVTFTFDAPWVLQPNTTYGFDVGGGTGYYYWETDGTNGNVYAGGTAYASGQNGVGDNTFTPETGDRVFVVGLTALTAPYAPFISSQPSPKTLYAGRTALFSANVGGSTPLAFQWRKDGTNNVPASAEATLLTCRALLVVPEKSPPSLMTRW